MSYKFQVGPAILSGTVVHQDAMTVKDAFNATSLSASNAVSGQTLSIANPTSLAGDGLVRNGSTLDLNIADMGSELSSAGLADTDEFAVSDDGTMKKIDFQHVRDSAFGAVSGDATIAAGGALTIENSAVESAMIATSVAGDGLTGGGGSALSVDVSSSGGLQISSNKLAIQLSSSGGLSMGEGLALDIGALDEDAVTLQNDFFIFTAPGGVPRRERVRDAVQLMASTGLSGSLAGQLSLDIDGLNALGGTGVAQGDHFVFSDDGAEKKITFSNLEDAIFGNVSGDATVAAGGVLTLAANSVSQTQMDDDAIGPDELAANAVTNVAVLDGTVKADKLDLDGSTDIGADLADADLLIVDDGAGGTNRVAALSRMKKYVYSAMSGDATASDTGALTIAAGAVEGSMLASNVAGQGLHVSGSKVHLSSSVGGAGLGFSSGVLSLDIDELDALGGTGVAQGDHFVFSDGGTEKKITFSNMEDAIFGNVSGDATIAAGGALTLGTGVVEHGMLAENIISGQGALTTPADDDVMMIGDDDDSGNVKKITLANLGIFFGGGTPTSRGDADVTLTEGVNYGNATISVNRAWSLPASSALSFGDRVIVKAAEIDPGVKITVTPVGSQVIDNGDPVELQDDYAAVTLVYVDTDKFIIV